MKQRCRNEIEQLHGFFQDWFVGATEDRDDNFARVANVLARDFQLVSPRGELHDRDSILALVRAAHGTRGEGDRVWTSDFAARWSEGAHCLATYREWQQTGGARTCRMATVWFREHASAPNRVEWVHLHETWLPVSS